MIITGKHVPRRTFLRGLGTAIALPMLDAMTPALAAPALRQSPTRMSFIMVPNGVIMKHWKPAAVGTEFEFTRILKPLEPFRQDLSVLTGLAHHNGNALGDGGGDHARAGACFLTGVHPKKTSGSDIQAGISADQVAAKAIGSQTRFASLELGLEDMRTVGNCDSGYSCAYTNSISWRGPASPMPPENNPRAVFERLFGDEDFSLSAEARARRLQYRKSILDAVNDRTRELTGQLGAADRRKIDEYLYAVREIELRIQKAEKANQQEAPAIEKPSGIPETCNEYARLMYDLQVVAFQTDLTRVSTLMMGREGSIRTYAEIGVPDPHHPLSHHRNQPDWIDKLARINTFHVELFAYFLRRLKETQDDDGTLLDHSMIVYASAISDGQRHTHEDLPVVVAGRGNNSLKPGWHIDYGVEKETPMTNLYLTLLDRLGVQSETLGDSNGKLDRLAV